MRAYIMTHPGGPEVLELKEVPDPKPKKNWVLIQVKGFGLNRSELYTRQGHSGNAVTLPRILGIECVGEVIDGGGTDLIPEQRVAAAMGFMGRKHDATIARKVPLAPGSIVAMDRGYNDYKLFAYSTANGIQFVTRLKENSDYGVVEDRKLPKDRNILSDQLIRFTDYEAKNNCPHILRRVVVWDQEEERQIVLLTNHLNFRATTISAIYKERWQIELFFKALEQNLRVKTFVGTTENALYTQIWTALIVMLLIKFLQFKSKFGWPLSNLIAFLRWNLFTYRDLWEWIGNPFDVLPVASESVQIPLPLPGIGQHLQMKTT